MQSRRPLRQRPSIGTVSAMKGSSTTRTSNVALPAGASQTNNQIADWMKSSRPSRGEPYETPHEQAMQMRPWPKNTQQAGLQEMYVPWIHERWCRMSYNDLFYTTAAMIEYGGNFVKRLGVLWRNGDLDNQRRLEKAFEAYFIKYSELVKERGVHLDKAPAPKAFIAISGSIKDGYHAYGPMQLERAREFVEAEDFEHLHREVLKLEEMDS